MIRAGPTWSTRSASTPMRFVRCVRSMRAAVLGRYSSSLSADSTRARVSGRMPSNPARKRLTVWCETPARRATS